MLVVHVVEDADVAALVTALPEPTRPQNRHVERFALQRSGNVACLAAWDDDHPIGYVFARCPAAMEA